MPGVYFTTRAAPANRDSQHSADHDQKTAGNQDTNVPIADGIENQTEPSRAEELVTFVCRAANHGNRVAQEMILAAARLALAILDEYWVG